MDAETPPWGRDETEMDWCLAPEEEEDVPPEAPRTELDLGGLALFQWNVGLGRPRMSPIIAMMSSSSMDDLGGRLGSIGTCGRLEKPKEGLTFCSRMPHLP
jgi:hypothetical protein